MPFSFWCSFCSDIYRVTFRATGLELTQEDLNIKARWDKTDCDGYIVTVFKGETKIEEAITKSEHFTIENTEADKEYYVQVEAIDDEKRIFLQKMLQPFPLRSFRN